MLAVNFIQCGELSKTVENVAVKQTQYSMQLEVVFMYWHPRQMEALLTSCWLRKTTVLAKHFHTISLKVCLIES